jgi:putative Mn2+ efflux pump MntP
VRGDTTRNRREEASASAAPGKTRKEQKSKGESNHAHFNIVILAVAASLNAIVIAPAFAADDAKSIAERVIAKWGKSTTKAMLRP